MGRPKKNRVKASVMIDRRLWGRVTALSRAERITKSEAINRLMWMGVLGRPSLKEKEEYSEYIDKIAEMFKSLVENDLDKHAR